MVSWCGQDVYAALTLSVWLIFCNICWLHVNKVECFRCSMSYTNSLMGHCGWERLTADAGFATLLHYMQHACRVQNTLCFTI